MNVIDYITEEVRRQGHDVTQVGGLERVGWPDDLFGERIANP